jgi:hypothetical protein
MKTLFHQVKFPDVLGIKAGHYYYCNNNDCSVGYFSQEEVIFVKKQLRAFAELKNQKLCYCFGIDVEEYVNSPKDRALAIKKFVIQKTKAGDCACAIRNPSGQCCLANFKQLDNTLDRACLQSNKKLEGYKT